MSALILLSSGTASPNGRLTSMQTNNALGSGKLTHKAAEVVEFLEPLFYLCAHPRHSGCKAFNAYKDKDMYSHAQFGDVVSSAQIKDGGLVVEEYEHINLQEHRWLLRWDGEPNSDGNNPDVNKYGADRISSYTTITSV